MPSYQSSHTGAEHDQYVTKTELVNLIYPIGAIYISTNSADPSLLFGGSWTRIEDTFLLAAGSTYIAGDIGGSADHTHTTNAGTTGEHILTVAEMPSHRHKFRTYYKDSYNIADGFVIWGCYSGSGAQAGLSAYNAYSGNQFTMTELAEGGDGSHTHPQMSVGTSSTSNLPPYLAVYIWKRVA